MSSVFIIFWQFTQFSERPLQNYHLDQNHHPFHMSFFSEPSRINFLKYESDHVTSRLKSLLASHQNKIPKAYGVVSKTLHDFSPYNSSRNSSHTFLPIVHSNLLSLYLGMLLLLFLLLTILSPQIAPKPTLSLFLGLCSNANLSERSSNILFSAPMCLLFVFLYYNINSI